MELSALYHVLRGRNISRQCFALFLVALLAAVFSNRFLAGRNDPNKCYALLEEGTWYHGNTWLTPGCVTGGYGINSIHECMKDRKIVFIGDKSTQGLYLSTLGRLNANAGFEAPDEDAYFSDDDVELEFLWDPNLNRSELYAYAEAFKRRDPARPTLLVIGAPQQYAEAGAVEDFSHKVEYLTNLSTPNGGIQNADLRHFTTKEGPGDLFLFAPVQEPFADEEDLPDQENTFREINAYLEEQARVDNIRLLSSFGRMTAGRPEKYYDNRMDPTWEVVSERVNLLIGLRCNYKFADTHKFPNVRTCCGSWKAPNWIQYSFLSIGLAILPLIVLLDYVWPILQDEHRTIVRGFSLYTAMISLLYITDRTHVFEQVRKLSVVSFNLHRMLAVALVVGFITIRRSAPPKKLEPGARPPDQPFLARDQTDELKGWMQLAIIIYHYNKGWTVTWFWEIIRTSVAAYLFLTGFGHTLYFMRKGDYSAKRFVAVLLRTNLLPSTLAYVMRTNWLIYYYMPLSSFWFVVVYLTMAVGSHYNKYKTFVVAKIAMSAYLVDTFISTQDLADTVVHLCNIVFRMDFNAETFFHYRVKIDQYIVFGGMLVALLYIWVQDTLQAEASSSGLAKFFRQYFRVLRNCCVAASGFIFSYFWYWANTNTLDPSHKEWTPRQPYITIIPITTYLILRNAHSSLRNYYSFAFAWLGRYSGEMYVIQNHIWLAGDQEAVLRTGFFHGDETVVHDRWRDLVFITPLYFIACCFIGESTATITSWFTKESAPAKSTAPEESAPVSEVEMGLLSGKTELSEDGDLEQEELRPAKRPPSVIRLLSTVRDACWPSSTRDRALWLLAWMWFLNLTYR